MANALRNTTATGAAKIDDVLMEFVSEMPPQAIAPPRDVTASAKRIQIIDLFDAPGPRARVAGVAPVPLWIGRVRDLSLLATSRTLISFASGAVTTLVVVWLVGAQRPSTVSPSTTQMWIPETTLSSRTFHVAFPGAQPTVEGLRPGAPSLASSLASATPRPVGTGGRRTVVLNRSVRPARAAPALSTNRGNATSGATSYRGSLAFESAPQGARVFVNGAFVGSTPFVLENLPVGSRAIRIEAEGYRRWSGLTQVVANRQTRVSATLDRAVR